MQHKVNLDDRYAVMTRACLMTQVTQILSDIEAGDPTAAEGLLPLVYAELRQLASVKLSHEKPGQTLQATALVHEAYMRLLGDRTDQHWNSRGHFFAAAAECMRRILVDQARKKLRIRHGGARQRIGLDEAISMGEDRARELVGLHEALETLHAECPVKAELVKLRYFAGLPHQEAAEILGISRATADRYWAYARAFLRSEMER